MATKQKNATVIAFPAPSFGPADLAAVLERIGDKLEAISDAIELAAARGSLKKDVWFSLDRHDTQTRLQLVLMKLQRIASFEDLTEMEAFEVKELVDRLEQLTPRLEVVGAQVAEALRG